MSINLHRSAWAIGALIALALIARQPATLLLASMLGAGLALSYLWAHGSAARIRCVRDTTDPRAFFGEETELTVDVANYNIFPIAHVEIRDDLPTALEVIGVPVAAHHLPRRSYLINVMALGGRQRVRRRYRIRCAQRGCHRIGPSEMVTGDPFGLFERSETLDDRRQLIVYPRVCPVVGRISDAARPSGVVRGDPWLFEDPERIAGVRPYRSTDPMRRIHWRATARTGELQTKALEPSYFSALAVFLDVATYHKLWEKIDERAFEFGVTTAASLLLDGYERGLAVGLYTNGTAPGARVPLKVPVGRSSRHIMDAMEALALIGPLAAVPMVDLLAGEHSALSFGTTIVAVTNTGDLSLFEGLARCGSRGNPVAAVVTGGHAATGADIPIYHAIEEGLPGGGSVITIR